MWTSTDGKLYRAGHWLLALPVPICAAMCLSPIAVWWLLMLVKHRRDRVTFRRIVIGGGSLLVTIVIAVMAGVAALRTLAASGTQ